LFGQSGDHLLAGARGVDRLVGNFNNDQIFGNQGDDVVNGGGGDNVLTGGADDDQFTGGAGSDHFVAGPGLDILLNSRSGVSCDVLDLGIFGSANLDAVLTITSNNPLCAVVHISDGDTINFLAVASVDLNDMNVVISYGNLLAPGLGRRGFDFNLHRVFERFVVVFDPCWVDPCITGFCDPAFAFNHDADAAGD